MKECEKDGIIGMYTKLSISEREQGEKNILFQNEDAFGFYFGKNKILEFLLRN